MSDTGDRPDQPRTGTSTGAGGTVSPGSSAEARATAAATGTPSPTIEERQWALFAHLSALAGFIVPFGNLIGPFVIWQVKKPGMPFVDEQGKEALNFQITVTLAVFVCVVLMLIAIGFLLLPIVAIGALVLTVIAAVKANAGEHYRYPMTWRVIT